MADRARTSFVATFAVAAALAAPACATGSAPAGAPASPPRDGYTAVVLDSHLPPGFEITRVRAVVDGAPVHDGPAAATLYRARLSEGDHTVRLVVDVRVPCGLTGAPYETLTATIARAFQVGSTGGLVYVDAFAQSAWLHPAERVHLLVSLRGLREGRWLYGRSPEAQQECGRLDPAARSRCVVQRLVDRSRAQRDVAALLCRKDKLEALDDMLAELDDGRGDVASERPSTELGADDPRRAVVEARAAQLEREAELCAGEDPSWMGAQEVTSDRSACAAYDEPSTIP